MQNKASNGGIGSSYAGLAIQYMKDPIFPLNISSKEFPKYFEETGDSDESDKSLNNYHNFTIKEKVLKEVLLNVSP
jgi:hypothetical protein